MDANSDVWIRILRRLCTNRRSLLPLVDELFVLSNERGCAAAVDFFSSMLVSGPICCRALLALKLLLVYFVFQLDRVCVERLLCLEFLSLRIKLS